MAYYFHMPESQDFKISDDKSRKILGHIRVKPSGILWRPKSSQVWHRLSVEEFGKLAEKHGKKQKM